MDRNPPTRHPRPAAFLTASVPPAFADRALRRIEAKDDDLGDSYRWATLGSLVRELGEEPVDTAAWAALLASRLEHDQLDATSTGQRAHALLTAIAQKAAETDALVLELQRLLLVETTA
jgi:hypothetical protein